MEQDFHGDFLVNVTWFFASFSGVLDCIVLILVWFERSLHSAELSGQNWSLTFKTNDVTKGRKDVDPHGRLQGVQGRNGLTTRADIWISRFLEQLPASHRKQNASSRHSSASQIYFALCRKYLL